MVETLLPDSFVYTCISLLYRSREDTNHWLYASNWAMLPDNYIGIYKHADISVSCL